MKSAALLSSILFLSTVMFSHHAAPTLSVDDAKMLKRGRHYQRMLTYEAQARFGVCAPIAWFAGQAEAESGWNRKARSRAGAQGLFQIMPPTRREIGRQVKALRGFKPYNAQSSIRAGLYYDSQMLKRFEGRMANEEQHHKIAFGAFNGGPGNGERSYKKCKKRKDCEETYWDDHVEKHARSKEMRRYPDKVFSKSKKYESWNRC